MRVISTLSLTVPQRLKPGQNSAMTTSIGQSESDWLPSTSLACLRSLPLILITYLILFRLISEVEELTESVESLKQKLLEAEQSLRNLEDTRMSLEKEIAVKSNSIFIDRQKCMAHRTRYPVVLKLAGYQ
uniref:Tektin n=1 Tax=Chelonoidis abingdonii TaxID=106734 RepID=A0A8C0J857_CHEAB